MRFWILLLASNAGLGYSPVVSGTVGTLAGIPAFYLMASLSPAIYLVTWLALFGIAVWAADGAGRIYGTADDGRIVIDELAGYLATVAFLPFSAASALLGFLWFRFFDILKPPPVRWVDRSMKNGFGVVFDDVLAGIYAAIALRLTLALFNLD
ncbi:MAG TPA: phosphatidylglycerophosphatase A [Desulfuromonadales bacterium]|nr:phosphatidylglycerophosphatase A [Desulfuromonadales bacterium]